jgi:hypothetical protein
VKDVPVVSIDTTPFIVITGNLIVLAYNVGVLLYALPVPSKRMKRWAPRLIEDSIYAALVLTLLSTMLYASDYIASFSGTSLKQIIAWLEDFMHKILRTYMFAKLASIPFYLVPGGGVVASLMLLPLSLVFYGIVTATASALVPLYILVELRSFLAALGALLYAIPFRIGRSIGASLIAFAVIGNIVFHFLPHWVLLFTTTVDASFNADSGSDNTLREQYTVYSVWGRIHDTRGNYPIYGIVMFYNIRDNSTYSYLVQPDGAYYAAPPYSPLPQGVYQVTLEYLGLKLAPGDYYTLNVPRDLKPTYVYTDIPYQRDMTVYIAYFLPKQAVISTSCYVKSINVQQVDALDYNITLDCEGTPYTTASVVFAAPATYTLRDVKVSNLASGMHTIYYQRAWRGIPVTQVVFHYVTYTSRYKFSILYRVGSPSIYKPTVVPTVENRQGGTGLLSIEDHIISMIVSGVGYSVAVFSFLTLASSLILSFARFLGANAPRVVFEP